MDKIIFFILGVLLCIFTLIISAITSKSTDNIGNVLIKIIIAVRNFKLHVKTKYNDLNILNREIDVKYSPAVVSYIYNTKLEPKKDILATILNLYNKKIISIEKIDGKYKIIGDYNIDLNILSPDERYIFLYFCGNRANIKNFSSEKWKQLVIEECEKNQYCKTRNSNVKEDEENKLGNIELILGIATVFMFRKNILNLMFMDAYPIPKEEVTIGILFLQTIILLLIGIVNSLPFIGIVSVCKNKIRAIKEILEKLTKKGEDELIKWIKFKNFIKDYTLIKDRKLEEIVIYEKYIPYAMTLGINKEYNNDEIKDFVSDYMKLIDKSVKNYLYTDLF